MGGGKGGKDVTKVELPEELQEGAKGVLAAAMQSAALPYSPNRGVSIAAFTPQQQAAFQGANAAAQAFGLPAASNQQMAQANPTPERSANGVMGYSTGKLFDQNKNASMSQEDQRKRDDLLKYYGTVGRDIDPRSAPSGGKGGTPSGGGK